MSKKVKVFVSLLVVVLLMVAIPATVVMGQEDETTTAPQAGVRDAFLDKVAEILGVSVEDLTAALEQGREEQREQIRSQATDNCSACEDEECTGEPRERWAEKQEMWQENEGRAFMRGRHMFTAPRGQGGLGQGQPVE